MIKHRQCGTPLYKRWHYMMSRCRRTSKEHKYYYDRGIVVCDRWKDFLNFKEDMEGTFKPHLELDRINNNKGYSPDNTRWVTRKRNNRNRKDTLYLEVDGVKKPARDWAEEVGINYNTLRSRLRYGWTVKKALNILAVLSMCWVPGTDTSTTGVSATVPLHQGNYWTTKQLYEMH